MLTCLTFTLSGLDFNGHLANNNISYNHVLSENSLSEQSGFLCALEAVYSLAEPEF